MPRLSPDDEGKFALVDVETGDYEVDRDEVAASDRLLARRPDNIYREATVHLPVRDTQGREQAIEAVIDTGFNGYLTLPPQLIAQRGLPFRRNGRAVLGDGSAITFDIHEAVILWDGRPRRIAIDAADKGGSALIKPLRLF